MLETGAQVIKYLFIKYYNYIFICIKFNFFIIKISSSSENDEFVMFAPNRESLDEAKEMVNKLMDEKSEPQLEFGAIYKAKVVEIREIGVMVTLYPSMQPALVHNSQLDQRKVYIY